MKKAKKYDPCSGTVIWGVSWSWNYQNELLLFFRLCFSFLHCERLLVLLADGSLVSVVELDRSITVSDRSIGRVRKIIDLASLSCICLLFWGVQAQSLYVDVFNVSFNEKVQTAEFEWNAIWQKRMSMPRTGLMTSLFMTTNTTGVRQTWPAIANYLNEK